MFGERRKGDEWNLSLFYIFYSLPGKLHCFFCAFIVSLFLTRYLPNRLEIECSWFLIPVLFRFCVLSYPSCLPPKVIVRTNRATNGEADKSGQTAKEIDRWDPVGI